MKRLLPLLLLLLTTTYSVQAQQAFYTLLADSAYNLTKETVLYDSRYFKIPYPNGDVPKGRGVCTDVIIRAYRKFNIDLQKEVHEDMAAHFNKYPKIWGLKRTDPNIDHRRVPNLMLFFERFGTTLPIIKLAKDYEPGDIVCWRIQGGATHIGLVSNKKSANRERYLIIHNIGWGQVLEDFLFQYLIIGHYRYNPKKL